MFRFSLFLLFLLFGLIFISNQTIISKTNKSIKNNNSTLQLLGHLSRKELKNTMKFYSKALGQKCSFCHVKDKSVDLNESIQNLSIRKRLKRKEIARQMIRMTREINKKYLNWNHSGGRKADQINCMLCHRGNNNNLLDNMKNSIKLIEKN